MINNNTRKAFDYIKNILKPTTYEMIDFPQTEKDKKLKLIYNTELRFEVSRCKILKYLFDLSKIIEENTETLKICKKLCNQCFNPNSIPRSF